jgi:hypothetical protein
MLAQIPRRLGRVPFKVHTLILSLHYPKLQLLFLLTSKKPAGGPYMPSFSMCAAL